MKRHLSFLGLILLLHLACQGSNEPEPLIIPVEYDFGADYSPNGNLIVFVRDGNYMEDIFGGLFTYDIRDSSLNPLSLQNTALLECPRFSPDGNRILYAQYRTLYFFDLTGDSIYRAITDEDTFSPDWCPDGDRIAYHKLKGEKRGVFIERLSTGDTYRMPTYYERPVWFGDGDHLAVISYEYEGAPQIIKVDTLGNVIEKLTDTPSWKYEIDICFKTGQICFSQQIHGEYTKIWIMNRDGSDLRRLVKDNANYPAFSPNGEWVVYTHSDDNDGSLWAIRTDGTENHRLTLSPFSQ